MYVTLVALTQPFWYNITISCLQKHGFDTCIHACMYVCRNIASKKISYWVERHFLHFNMRNMCTSFLTQHAVDTWHLGKILITKNYFNFNHKRKILMFIFTKIFQYQLYTHTRTHVPNISIWMCICKLVQSKPSRSRSLGKACYVNIMRSVVQILTFLCPC